MPNDTPFVELPSPPRSPTQTAAEADIRGYDHGTPTDDEHARALAYRKHIVNMGKNRASLLARLGGNKAAFRSLQHKTLPLTKSAPPYIEG